MASRAAFSCLALLVLHLHLAHSADESSSTHQQQAQHHGGPATVRDSHERHSSTSQKGHHYQQSGSHRGSHTSQSPSDLQQYDHTLQNPSKLNPSEISSPEDSTQGTSKKNALNRRTQKPYLAPDATDAEKQSNVSGEKREMGTPHHPRPNDPTCSACLINEVRRNMSLQAIKAQILEKLGMKVPPNATGRTLPPWHELMDLQQPAIQSDQPLDHSGSASSSFFGPMGAHVPYYDEEEDYFAMTSMIIVVAQTTKMRHGGGLGTNKDIQHFRFSERSTHYKVGDAVMYVYVPVTSKAVRVLVYRVLGNATEHESMTVLLVAASKFSEHRKPSWVEIDTKKLLTEWLKNPRNNLGVVIKLEDETGHSIPYSVEAHEKSGESKQPFIKMNTVGYNKHRNKRNIGLNCQEKSTERRCCRHPLTVDFESFGWNFIIAPKSYEANYCSGECPYVFLQNYMHTHVVQQTNMTASPCCAARKMSSISMLYFDSQDIIIYSTIPNMVVDSCGCQ